MKLPNYTTIDDMVNDRITCDFLVKFHANGGFDVGYKLDLHAKYSELIGHWVQYIAEDRHPDVGEAYCMKSDNRFLAITTRVSDKVYHVRWVCLAK